MSEAKTVHASQRLIFALDVGSLHEAEELIEALKDRVGAFKVGLQLYVAEGPEIVRRLRDAGSRVFLDLKFHDIPNTAASAALEAARLGAFMFNVHASGGLAMMKECVRRCDEWASAHGRERPLILGVTLLTSMDERAVEEVGFARAPSSQVLRLAELSRKAGLDGVVASPQEVKSIKERCGPDFIVVAPGVRPSWWGADDHKRSASPRDAVLAGADYIVVGRPIKDSADPGGAAERICEEIEAALKERGDS